VIITALFDALDALYFRQKRAMAKMICRPDIERVSGTHVWIGCMGMQRVQPSYVITRSCGVKASDSRVYFPTVTLSCNHLRQLMQLRLLPPNCKNSTSSVMVCGSSDTMRHVRLALNTRKPLPTSTCSMHTWYHYTILLLYHTVTEQCNCILELFFS